MRKPSFAVTASAIVTLCLIGAFRVIYEPLLPPSPTEYLVTVPPSEPIPAPIVEIDWKRSIPEGQTEAKRRKLGLLIFLLDPSNFYSKQLELHAFRDAEVSRFVNRNYVPVKIDLDQYPEWAQSLLPIQRLGRYIEPGVDLIVTDQDGKLINHFIVDNPFQYSGPETVLPFLINSQVKLAQDPEEQLIQTQQSNDLEALVNASAEALPDFQGFAETLKDEFKFRSPGEFRGQSTKFRPVALRVLAKTGAGKLSATISRELALSPLYDPIDGGFFREARTSTSVNVIDSSKSSAQNALGAEVMAQLACLENDPGLRSLALDMGNEVMTEFSEGDSICASRLNDQGVDLRSRRSSLTTTRLNSILTPSQEKRLLTFVTRDRNPDQDFSSLLSLDAFSSNEFQTLRQVLRQKIGYTPALSEPDHIAVCGYIAARLFDLYRYTGDPRFLSKAQMIADQVYSALGEDSVARIYGNRQLGPGWLGTYLGVADCGLANFAATGEIYPLRNGSRALLMALQKFKDPKTGMLVNTPVVASPTFTFTSSIPDLADRGRESLNAQALRLAYHYSVICEEADHRALFAAFTQAMMVRLNSIMNRASSAASGYFDAAFDTIQNRALIVGGPNRFEDALKISKKFPLLPVYPLSSANKDRETSYYIKEGTVLRGPLSEREIEKNLKEAGLPYPE